MHGPPTGGRSWPRFASPRPALTTIAASLLLSLSSLDALAHAVAEGDKGYIQEITGVQAGQTPAAPATPTATEQRSSLFGTIFAQLVIGPAAAQAPAKSEEFSISLKPGEGGEVKMDMKKGAKATYSWKVEGGTVNHDTHGDGAGGEVSYKKGRGVAGDDGIIVAGFDGNHGWFWRNRGSAPVTVKVTATGDFGSLKRAK